MGSVLFDSCSKLVCLVIAELTVRDHFGSLGPGTNTELGSGVNQVCWAIAELGIRWKFIYTWSSWPGANAELQVQVSAGYVWLMVELCIRWKIYLRFRLSGRE